MHQQGQGAQALRVRRESEGCGDQSKQFRGGRSLAVPGNPYDGHTLSIQLERITKKSVRGPRLSRSLCDRFAGFQFRSEARDESSADTSAQVNTGDRAGGWALQARWNAEAQLSE